MSFKPRSTRIAAGLLFLLFVAAGLSDFLSPVPAEQQDLTRFYAPPTWIHFIDPVTGFHWHPSIITFPGLFQTIPSNPSRPVQAAETLQNLMWAELSGFS